MFKKLMWEQVISFENNFNAFVYYLRQLPFFEQRIPYDFFQHNKFKRTLSLLAFVFGILMQFVGRLVYAALFLLIPYIILKQFVMGNTFEYEETLINVFFMMNCVCGSLINTVILKSSDEDYMMLNVLRINPKEHYVGELCFKLIVDFGIFFAVLLIFDVGLVNSLVLVVLMTAFRCIGELWSLIVYSKIPFLYKRIVSADVIVILVCVYFAYVNPYMHGHMVSVDAFVFNPVLLAVIGVLGLICFIVLCTYRHYPKLARKRVKRSDAEYAEAVLARSRIKEVEAKPQFTGAAALLVSKHEKKKGFSYLNHIFFERNGKLFVKSQRKRWIWIAIFFAAAIAYILIKGGNISESIWNSIIEMDTVWFIIMYVVSSSHTMCKAMFYNCDKYMMRYSYYTKKSAILSNYYVRLKHFIILDIRTAVEVAVGMAAVVAATGHILQIYLIIPSVINMLLFSVIISIYHTAMYHVFQPYNELMKVKSPMFTICNIMVAVIGILLIWLPLNRIATLLLEVVAIMALLLFSHIMVKEFGPDNFYVKL